MKKVQKRPRLHLINEALAANEKSGYWLAKQTGISYNSINGYVNNRIEPSLSNLNKIAEALKIDTRELVKN